MKTLGVIFCCLLFAATVFAVSGPPPVSHRSGNGGALDTRWGPDTWGYRARDIHETDGPTFAWRDISGTGTRVHDLTDDDVVGPFQIGFNFHYYWYDVHQFWIGSNGYIKFSRGGQLAQPIPMFPNATAPNDVIGPYVADWIFGSDTIPSRCYYETRGTDSLIVMWKNVRAWNASGNRGNHNFELILSNLDSSFTFQYDTLTTSDVSNNNIAVGMENVTGQLGISCFFGIYPPAYDAIKFYYPDTITYVAHDLGSAGVQDPISGGFFIQQGDTLHPWLSVQNVGNQPEASFHAVYSVRNASNGLLASADTLIAALNPAQFANIQYPPLWAAGAPALFRITGRVNLTGDINHTNDSVRVQCRSVHLPAELRYDDNTDEQDWNWQGGHGGLANQFVPPVYPVRITQLNYYIGALSTAGTPFTAQVFIDSVGAPGRMLWSARVTSPTAGAWNTVPITDTLRIDSGAFYVGWLQADSTIQFGVDTNGTEGISRRAWEFADGFAEFRNSQTSNPMIRCTLASLLPDHRPVITGHLPLTLDTVYQNTSHQFSVTATDQDNDSLRYRWTRNGAQVGTQPSANIAFPTLGAVVVKCVVSDGQLADSVMWNVTVVEPNAAEDKPASVPGKFALRAAYPNPFNPSTSLGYDVARDGEVTLKIYDLLGNEVATLVNRRLAAGSYRVNWNAASQPSGTYFAVLTAKDVHLIQKLLLMK